MHRKSRTRSPLARRGPGFALALVFALLALPAAAYAGSDTVWGGTLYRDNGWQSNAPRHSLDAVTFIGASSQINSYGQATQGCVNALENGGGWAGTTYCFWPSTQHPYCGCALRYGYAMAYSPPYNFDNTWVNGTWSQTW